MVAITAAAINVIVVLVSIFIMLPSLDLVCLSLQLKIKNGLELGVKKAISRSFKEPVIVWLR
ncbi:hypothetical protein [Bartonella sp. LJL80]